MVEQPGLTNLLEAALRASALRGKAIANNVANLDTPGYRRIAVAFEQELAKAMESGQVNLADLQMKVYQPGTTPVNSQGNDVNLDVEIGDMIKNGAAYKTYMRLLEKLYSQMELAMQGL